LTLCLLATNLSYSQSISENDTSIVKLEYIKNNRVFVSLTEAQLDSIVKKIGRVKKLQEILDLERKRNLLYVKDSRNCDTIVANYDNYKVYVKKENIVQNRQLEIANNKNKILFITTLIGAAYAIYTIFKY
jgi:hypothetical protein